MIATDARAEELYGLVRTCTLCPLSASRTLAVPGEGPLSAEVMCIGEAPGVNEDKQGRPFVGAAGQFLSELLGAAGLKREDVYICNVLKCRPPGNRDPMPHEIEACAEYLDLQIDMVDPLVIVTLGRFSMAKWFTGQAISRIHGSVKEADGRLIVPMYHPAAALHQGNLRQVLLDDFAKLARILEQARAARGQGAVAGPLERNLRPEERAPAPEAAASLSRQRASAPTWSGSAYADEDVEFDPGDHEPVRPSPRTAAGTSSPLADETSPSVVEEGPGNRVSPAADEPGGYAGTAAGPTMVEPVSLTEESTAEQEAAPAAKSQQQLSLFE